MDVAFTAVDHFETFARFLGELRANEIGLYEHRYDGTAFGSFSAVLGFSHRRVRFDWDGRKFLLSVSVGEFASTLGPGEWVHEMNISLPKGAGLYEEIASNAEYILAT